MNEIEKQREYYSKTAKTYDSSCCFDANDEHYMALSVLVGLLDHFEAKSLLDVGCGTGRALAYLQKRIDGISFTGIEPVSALRDEAKKKVKRSIQIVEGDATKLQYRDGQFDCVTMFGVLHHIPNPEDAIAEALRVSRRIVFLSDHNIYGMGSGFTKFVKQSFRDLHQKKLLKIILTKGKGYHHTDWDGIFYPFSLIDHIPFIRSRVEKLHIFPTKTSAINIYRNASHLAVLGIKKAQSGSEED